MIRRAIYHECLRRGTWGVWILLLLSAAGVVPFWVAQLYGLAGVVATLVYMLTKPKT